MACAQGWELHAECQPGELGQRARMYMELGGGMRWMTGLGVSRLLCGIPDSYPEMHVSRLIYHMSHVMAVCTDAHGAALGSGADDRIGCT